MLLHVTAALNSSLCQVSLLELQNDQGAWAPGVKCFISVSHSFKMAGCLKLYSGSGCYRKEKALLLGMAECLGKETYDTHGPTYQPVQTLKCL